MEEDSSTSFPESPDIIESRSPSPYPASLADNTENAEYVENAENTETSDSADETATTDADQPSPSWVPIADTAAQAEAATADADEPSRSSEQIADIAPQADTAEDAENAGIRNDAGAENFNENPIIIIDDLEPEIEVEVEPTDTPEANASQSPAKKRRRSNNTPKKSSTPKIGKKKKNLDNDDDDDDNSDDSDDEGLICTICYTEWEMSGPHRLVSLRCGHLFGDSCIRRWLSENYRMSGEKTCPQCKAKATKSDIRFIYGKRVRALDRTEEHELRRKLEETSIRKNELVAELEAFRISQVLLNTRIKDLEREHKELKQMLRFGGRGGGQHLPRTEVNDGMNLKVLQHLKNYKLHLNSTVEISREPGCRVMACSQQHSLLLASQKSSQSLFPGYGIRFVDTASLRPMMFLHTSTKMLRDICLSSDHQLFSYASMETRTKVFDIRVPQTMQTALATECSEGLWACAMGSAGTHSNHLYLGAQHGSTFVYDLRDASHALDEYKTPGDRSPVVNIAAVASNEVFPQGGVLICKLQSVWFYEHSGEADAATLTRLDIRGPFVSMCYDDRNETLLLATRSLANGVHAHFIFGGLGKVEGTPIFQRKSTFFGSKVAPVMTRCTQVAVEANTLVAGYIQDAKQLAIFDVCRSKRQQSIPVQDIVYDMCPVYSTGDTLLAALTECKCRIYKLVSDA